MAETLAHVSPVGAAALGHRHVDRCRFARATCSTTRCPEAPRRGVPFACRAPNSRDGAGGVDHGRIHLRNSRVGICGTRSQWQPGAQRAHFRGSRAPRRRACSCYRSEPGLDDNVAHGGVIAARQQNVIVTEDVLRAARILNQRPKRAAAAVLDLISPRCHSRCCCRLSCRAKIGVAACCVWWLAGLLVTSALLSSNTARLFRGCANQ